MCQLKKTCCEATFFKLQQTFETFFSCLDILIQVNKKPLLYKDRQNLNQLKYCNMIKLSQNLSFLDCYIMALSIYNISSYSSEMVEIIRNSSIRLKVFDFVKDSDSESQLDNRYDSIPLKILTSFFYIIEVIAAMIIRVTFICKTLDYQKAYQTT